MTIDKAIEILTQHITRAWPASDPDLRLATQLGLEALEEIKKLRELGVDAVVLQFPGETLD